MDSKKYLPHGNLYLWKCPTCDQLYFCWSLLPVVGWAFFVMGVNTRTFLGPWGSILPRKWKSAVFSDNLCVSLGWFPESCKQWTMPSSFIKTSLKSVWSTKDQSVRTSFDLKETEYCQIRFPVFPDKEKGSERWRNLSEVTPLTSNTEWELELRSSNFWHKYWGVGCSKWNKYSHLFGNLLS